MGRGRHASGDNHGHTEGWASIPCVKASVTAAGHRKFVSGGSAGRSLTVTSSGGPGGQGGKGGRGGAVAGPAA